MFIFPAHVLNPETVSAGPERRVISGGVSLSGDEDVIQTDGGGRWSIKYGEMWLDSPALERLWTQWDSYLAGGARTVLVPLLSVSTAPRPVTGGEPLTPSDIVSDDDVFPSIVGFGSPHVRASLVSTAPLRSTEMVIQVTQGARITGGEKFSVGGRGFLIERVRFRSGMQATCDVWPPCREALSSGAALNFDWPTVRCRAVIGQDIIPPIGWGNYAPVSISFVEDFSNAG